MPQDVDDPKLNPEQAGGLGPEVRVGVPADQWNYVPGATWGLKSSLTLLWWVRNPRASLK
jgi:hypothetical protein